METTCDLSSTILSNLIERCVATNVVLAEGASVPHSLSSHPLVKVVRRDLKFGASTIVDLLRPCDVSISCLEHSNTQDITKLVVDAINLLKPKKNIRHIVINTEKVDTNEIFSPNLVQWLLAKKLEVGKDEGNMSINMKTIIGEAVKKVQKKAPRWTEPSLENVFIIKYMHNHAKN
ncbi:hypothetical protein TrRE_jg5305, partial [Triparma retinervis]